MGGEAGCRDDVVDQCCFLLDGLQDLRLHPVRLWFGGMADCFAVGCLRGRGEWPELFQDVVDAFDELCSVANQGVAAARRMTIDLTWDSEDLAALFAC